MEGRARPQSGIIFRYRDWVHSGSYGDSLGENRWPTETCRVVSKDLDRFVEAARTVGFTRDGAVIISTDGTLQEQMVRIKSQSDIEGTRRLSMPTGWEQSI